MPAPNIGANAALPEPGVMQARPLSIVFAPSTHGGSVIVATVGSESGSRRRRPL